MERGALVLENRTLGQDVIAAVGPEGGFSPGEVEAVQQAGGRLVSLGPRRLRTETAGLVLAAKVFALKAEL
jgi:16S rRNA (uracil1498-N3)-methyltransferase